MPNIDIAEIGKFIEDRARIHHEHGDHAGAAALVEMSIKLAELVEPNYLGKLYRTDYTVIGNDDFPLDMLRYTCSWFADEVSANMAYHTILDAHEGCVTPNTVMSIVRLSKYHRDLVPQLARERWSAKFRWRVGEQSTVEV